MLGGVVFGTDCNGRVEPICLDVDVGALANGYVACPRVNADGIRHIVLCRHVNVGTADVHVAASLTVPRNRYRIGPGRRVESHVARDGEATVLDLNSALAPPSSGRCVESPLPRDGEIAVLDLDGALPGFGRDGVIAGHADIEVALSADAGAVVTAELHVVGAVPGPGSGLVAGGRAVVVLRSADVDPVGGERHAG